MSPNMFSITITSKSHGLLHHHRRAGVDIEQVGFDVGKFRLRSAKMSRCQLKALNTLALSTSVTGRGGRAFAPLGEP